MATLSRTYADNAETRALVASRERTGGPRRLKTTSYEKGGFFKKDDSIGSHMPLDTDIHWRWHNPLNVIPAVLLFVVVLGLVAAIVS